MITFNEIERQLTKLGIDSNNYDKYYWYFYSVTINGLAVAKPGSSTVNLLKCIYNYINVEHSNQKITNFSVIAVIEFNQKKSLVAAEKFVKENNNICFNVFKNQPYYLEQYQLKPFYDEIKKYLEKFPFSSKSYINPNADDIITNVSRLQKILYLTTNYQYKLTVTTPTVTTPPAAKLIVTKLSCYEITCYNINGTPSTV